MLPLVSIITPTYNHEKFIGECIESVIAQTYPHWEMIIIDDGSKDQTAAICKAYAQKDSRIKYQYQENKGIFRLKENYNKALDLASGSHIAILEGDDLWYDTKLEKQMKVFEDQGILLVFSRADILSMGKLKHLDYTYDDKTLSQHHNRPTRSFVNLFLGNNHYLHPLTVVIKKEALLKVGGFIQLDKVPTVDFNTFLEISKLGPFGFVNESLGFWREQPAQTTKKMILNIFEGWKISILDFIKDMSDADLAHIGTSRHYIYRFIAEKEVVAYSRAGRMKLLEKNYTEARNLYTRSLTYPLKYTYSWVWRLRSLVGLVFSWLHMDVEGLAKLMGKKAYK